MTTTYPDPLKRPDFYEVAGLRLAAPTDADVLHDPHDRPRGERRLPYWARLWPCGAKLAELIAGDLAPRVAGRDVIELGCGLGAPGMAAARAGARATLTDAAAEALSFAAGNARRNGVDVAVSPLAWDRVPEAFVGHFDVALAADVMYDKAALSPLLGAFQSLLRPGGEAWLADPARGDASVFKAAVATAQLVIAETRTENYRGPLWDEYDDREDPVIYVYRLIRQSD